MAVGAVYQLGGDGVGPVRLVGGAARVAEPGLAAEGDEFEPFAIRAPVEGVTLFAVAAGQHLRDFQNDCGADAAREGFKESGPVVLKDLFDCELGFQSASPSKLYTK